MNKPLRKTKIICTMGPRLFDENLIEPLIEAGMNVARFNFSHDIHENHKKRFDQLNALREKYNYPIATMLDTKGPEIRLGNFRNGRITLKKGDKFTLSTEDVEGSQEMVYITYPGLVNDVKAGSVILIDDGLVALTVDSVSHQLIHCTVMNDGVISDHKGVNVPDVHLSLPFISERDRDDILFGIETGFDLLAASFTRSAEDVLAIREILKSQNCTTMNIIAKIENKEGVRNIDEIIRVADGIMVARGDLGVEIPMEEVPSIQKMLIRKCYNAGKPVITATQMLDSMIKNPRPTRAEVTDVANAIYDGTSAIMLSGETAAGLYPVEAVRTMNKIALRTEADINYTARFKNRETLANPDVTSAISHATCTSAMDLHAAAIITVTKSGQTAKMISKFRPSCPILSCTTSRNVYYQLNLSWGVTPLMIDEEKSTDALFEHAVQAGVDAGMLQDGELVVMTAGLPLGISGTTNMMKVHVVGHILVTGTGVTHRSVCASLCVAKSPEQAVKEFKPGQILVIRQTNNNLLPLVRKAAGLIVEEDDPAGHGAVAGMSIDIPVIIGAKNATHILHSGAVVSLDAARGVVSYNPETGK